MTTTAVKENYQSPVVAKNYDQERFANLAGKTFDNLEKRAIRRILRPLVLRDPPAAVLDVPCGTGRITHLLLQMGLHVVGGDISRAMLDQAQDRCAAWPNQISFQQMDLDHLDLPDGSFDLVTCIRLLHHLDSPARAAILQELSRVHRHYVLVNVSLSTPYYRLRRRAKRLLGQGVSRASSTWVEIIREISMPICTWPRRPTLLRV